MLPDNFFRFFKDVLLVEHLKVTLSVMITVHLCVLLGFRNFMKWLLTRKRFVLHAILCATYGAIVSFFLLLTGLGLSINVLNEVLSRDIDSAFNLSNANAVGLFFVFFLTKIKQLVLRRELGELKVKRTILKRILLSVNFTLILWFTFLLLDSFGSYKNANYNITLILRKGLYVYSLWTAMSVVAYGTYVLGDYYSKKMEEEQKFVHEIFIRALYGPSLLFLVGSTFVYTLSFTVKETKLGYHVVFISSFFLTLLRFVSLLEKRVLSGKMIRKSPNSTLVQGIASFARVFLGLLFVVLAWSSVSEGNIAQTVSTILGGAGFGLAFAARPIVENYLSGFVIYLEGSFRVGDWIYFTDDNIEGVIEYIGARATSIRTFDKRLLYVPNSFFSSKSVVNATKMTHRRILQKIPVGWVTKLDVLDEIIQDIRVMVYNHPGIDRSQALLVHFTGFATQGLEITIYALTKTKNWHTSLNVQEHILREAKHIIEKHAGASPSHISYRISTDDTTVADTTVHSEPKQ